MRSWNLARPDQPRRFVGLKYYIELITSKDFYLVLQNTIVLTVVSLAICLVLGMTIAFLIYRSFKGVGFARTLLIAPFFISDAVIGVFWRNVMLGASYGLLPKLFSMVGIGFPNMLADFPLALIIILIVWKWTPFFMLIITAGLQGIPDEVIEAAHVDGANGFTRITKIIIPMLRHHVNISLMLGLIFVLKTFGLIFTATLGGPGYASTNLPYYVYRTALLGSDIGRGATIAVLIIIVSLILLNFVFRAIRSTMQEAS